MPQIGHDAGGTLRAASASTRLAAPPSPEEQLPFLVALNKCDRGEPQPERVWREMAQLGVRGCEVELLEISAKTGAGVPAQFEMVTLLFVLRNNRFFERSYLFVTHSDAFTFKAILFYLA